VALRESRNVFIYSLLSVDPFIRYNIWHSCINPYVGPTAPNAIGPVLVVTKTIAIIYVILDVNPDILPRAPYLMNPLF
jgi:hypothetical protein